MQRLELTQQFIQSLRQEQIMAPQQIQALEILLATVPELQQKISQELAENPTLELLENATEQLVGNPVEEGGPAADPRAEEEASAMAAEKDEALATLIQLNKDWRDHASMPFAGRGMGGREEQERRQFLFDSLADEPTLQDTLLTQLRQSDDVDERSAQICEQIVGSIDDTGYLRRHISDIAITVNADLPEVERALATVQSFDPAGVGARDLRECLLLQLQRRGEKGTLAYQVVDKHLDAIGRNQIPKVARALRTSSRGLYEILQEIRRLNPFPGSAIAPTTANMVYPEVFIEKDEQGEWHVRSNRDYVPRLRISPYYQKLLEDPKTPREAKTYIREKVTSSKLLLRAIVQRQSTIERIAGSLLEFQHDFFDDGVMHMRPLVMSQVAEDIGVHETTVSRAIANKYVQTPHGLFPLKHFFSSGYEAGNGEMVSSHSIKQKIQDFVDAEDPKRPLSDKKLADLLNEEGFKVARRTVAKYREEGGIMPSHMRRNF